MFDDPTITEVRRWRARMVKDAGGTLHGLVAMLRKNAESNAGARNGKAIAKSAGRTLGKTTGKSRSSSARKRGATKPKPRRGRV